VNVDVNNGVIVRVGFKVCVGGGVGVRVAEDWNVEVGVMAGVKRCPGPQPEIEPTAARKPAQHRRIRQLHKFSLIPNLSFPGNYQPNNPVETDYFGSLMNLASSYTKQSADATRKMARAGKNVDFIRKKLYY
jgi:hypothetical protein